MKTLLLAIACVVALPSVADAAVVDFEGLSGTLLGSPLTTGGLLFTSSVPQATSQGRDFYLFQAGGNGTKTIANNYLGARTTITYGGAGGFFVTSIDVGDINNNGARTFFTYTLNYLNRTGAEISVFLDAVPGMQTIQLQNVQPGIGLASFSYVIQSAAGNTAQIDNFVWAPAIAAVIPEPSTWLMMLAGFGAIGMTMRRVGKAGRLPAA